jgi:hypothetical protein
MQKSTTLTTIFRVKSATFTMILRVTMVHLQGLVEPMGFPLRPNQQKQRNKRNGIFEP